MKKIQTVPLTLMILVSLLSLGFFSCTKMNDRQVLIPVAGAQDAILFDQNAELLADQLFLNEALINSMAEISAAKLARKKSKNAGIIALSYQLEKDHQLYLQELETFAEKKHILLPKLDQQLVQQKLAGLAEKNEFEFDKEYCRHQINSHKIAIMLYERQIRETSDIGINNWIEKTLPGLRATLESTELCLKTVG